MSSHSIPDKLEVWSCCDSRLESIGKLKRSLNIIYNYKAKTIFKTEFIIDSDFLFLLRKLVDLLVLLKIQEE